MKTWTLRIREADRHNFEDLWRGVKSIETRAASPKFQEIKPGDRLIFLCGRDRLTKGVKGVHHFPSVEKMFAEIELRRVMPRVQSVEEALQAYHSYPGYEQKLAQYGILAFELEPV